MRQQITSIAFLLVCMPFVSASARTWTSNTGNSIEAELVAVKGGWVQLRKAGGELVSCPIERFSAADQQYVRAQKIGPDGRVQETKPKEKSSKGPAVPDDLTVTAKARWSNTISIGPDNKEKPRDLEIVVETVGESAVAASAYGFVKVTSARYDNGKSTKLEEGFGHSELPSDKFVKIDRSDHFAKHPEDGVGFSLNFAHPPATVKEMASVSGTFKLMAGGKRETIEVKSISRMRGKPIVHPALKTAGVSLKLGTGKDSLDIDVGGNVDAIDAMELTHSNGKPLENISTGKGSVNGQVQYNFFLEKSVPPDAQLKITLLTGAKPITVPFKFSNIAIPAEGSQESGSSVPNDYASAGKAG